MNIMDSKLSTMGVNSEIEFNTILFEKRLTGLKDSQDSINSCCQWCLNNRQHHKKIVCCWLNVLKRVKIEHRLTLFYLANDVIQYSKRRNYDFVESWGTTLQKATTMVRDEKVKHKILRIFKIWEQRGIYGEEFLTDLCGLISASPSARKGDETHEFQSAYLIQKIKTCSRLESDTDVKLKQLKEHNPKIQIESESLISSLKDRAHVDDVEKEVEDYIKQMENYINALKLEIKSRITLISLLAQAQTQLENDKKDVKLVTTAYKTFATRVKTLKKKLDEKIPSLCSPVPSPDINAPSPSPDSDIELSSDNTTSAAVNSVSPTTYIPNLLNSGATLNAGYYNPVPPPNSDPNSNFNKTGYSSFMDSNMSFNLQNFNASSLFGNNQSQSTTAGAANQTQTTNSGRLNDAISSLFPSMTCPPPPPAPNITNTAPPGADYQYGGSTHVPLMPPPMPPFSKSDENYGVPSYGDTYNGNNNSNYVITPTYEPTTTPYQPTTTPYQPSAPPYQPTTTPYQPSSTSYQPSSVQYEPSPQTYQPTTPPTTTYEPFNSNYPPPSLSAPPYQNSEPPNTNYPPPSLPLPAPYAAEEYNPEEELETWEPEPNWEPPPTVELDTPESPPLFEKEGYGDPVEYHDANVFEGAADVDHRVLPSLITDPVKKEEKLGHRSKDVDHRNLISLTGSPSETRPAWTSQVDQDYRKSVNQGNGGNLDRDYRVPFNIENFKLPPPPPPPKMLINQNVNPYNQNVKIEETTNDQKVIENVTLSSTGDTQNVNNIKAAIQPKRHGLSPRKLQDNNESIDMDLSDDDHEINMDKEEVVMEDLDINAVQNNPSPGSDCFELPPPFPDLLDDLDANKFLDNVTENLDLEEFDTGELEGMDMSSLNPLKPGLLGHAPPPPPHFAINFINPVTPNMFNTPPPVEAPLTPNMLQQELPPDWMMEQQVQDFNSQEFEFHNPDFPNQEFLNRELPFRGRGNNTRGNFIHRGAMRTRGSRGNRGNNDFRGRGGRGVPWAPRGGRGNNRGGPDSRGNWGGRGRGGRGWVERGRGGGDAGRGRGGGDPQHFVTNFRGNFRGGF